MIVVGEIIKKHLFSDLYPKIFGISFFQSYTLKHLKKYYLI